MGLHRAGFDVTGVDINPQPRYPFKFIQGDALEACLSGYDFVWASPPCQAFTIAGMRYRQEGKEYPDLVDATRKKLIAAGIPWVMENVPGAPMRRDMMLCGSIFGLKVVRHRIFEMSFPAGLTPPCQHGPETITVCGHGTPSWQIQNRRKKGLVGNPTIAEKRAAMEIDWTDRGELSQAIPPSYSEYIARRFLEQFSLDSQGR
jgi:DNA (cytosine-5)-methyltransferase 1